MSWLCNNSVRHLIKGLFLLIVFAIGSSFTTAHDGGFGHSKRTLAFLADDSGWTLEYRLRVMADEALVQAAHADANGDGTISTAEKDAYFAAQGSRLAKGFVLRDESGVELPIAVVRYELGPSLTQTFTFRIESKANSLTFDDRNFPHKPGVVQIVNTTSTKAEIRTPIDMNHAEFIPLRITKTP